VPVASDRRRRRAWSAEQKARIIAESYGTDETVSAVARRHGLTPQQLFGWRRAVLRRPNGEADGSGSAFAPVIVDTHISTSLQRLRELGWSECRLRSRFAGRDAPRRVPCPAQREVLVCVQRSTALTGLHVLRKLSCLTPPARC
jgi:transposase-like protein